MKFTTPPRVLALLVSDDLYLIILRLIKSSKVFHHKSDVSASKFAVSLLLVSYSRLSVKQAIQDLPIAASCGNGLNLYLASLKDDTTSADARVKWMCQLCGIIRAVSLADCRPLSTAAAAGAYLPLQHAWLSQLVLLEQPAYIKQSFSKLMNSLANCVLMHHVTSANIWQCQFAAPRRSWIKA